MNSIIRPRRLRRTEAIREMVRENHLAASDLSIHYLFMKKILKRKFPQCPELTDGILMAY